MLKRQSPTTVLFRTAFIRRITQYELLILLGSNHLLRTIIVRYNVDCIANSFYARNSYRNTKKMVISALSMINLLEMPFLSEKPNSDGKNSSCFHFHVAAEGRIDLMRDYVTCPKFTNKPRLPDIFQTFVTFELFSRLYSFHLCCFVNYFLIKFKTCILKPRLGGDFSYSDVIMHKGHSSFQDLPPYVFADV